LARLSQTYFSETSGQSEPVMNFAQFKKFVYDHVTAQASSEKRYFVALSLREAQSIRRVMHLQHPIFKVILVCSFPQHFLNII
jgi:hypothetical protein